MRDLWDWLDTKTRIWLVAVLLVIICAAGAVGYATRVTVRGALQAQGGMETAVRPTMTPTTPPAMVLLWTGSSATSGPLSPMLSITDAQAAHGISLIWRCLPTPDGLPTSFSVNIRQDGHTFAWIGNTVQCGGSGSNYINTLHGGTFQVDVTATGPWTVRVLARTP